MNRNEQTQHDAKSLRIWQQNLNRSNNAQQAMLETVADENIDIICIQEPYIDFRQQSRANSQWFTVYPPASNKPAK
ncbi:hypothetical protein OF83DRAFT_1070482, partial [Amylostereum chailletii]